MPIIGHMAERKRLDHIAGLSVGPQSFLFAGPRRLGKFLVALEFAEKLTGSPTNDSRANEDLLILRRRVDNTGENVTTDGGSLSVEDIRHAEEFLSRYPRAGKYRVLIIDEAERLTVSAENALLKLLEEPNSTAAIILVTHLPEMLLPTVRSRLFTVPFVPLSSEELRAAFPHATAPDFFFALGLPGLIVDAEDHPENFERTKEYLRQLFRLSRLTWAQRFALAETLAGDPDHLLDTLEIWMIGLGRQGNKQLIQSMSYVSFLEAALETLRRISAKEGNPRLLLEQLFTRV